MEIFDKFTCRYCPRLVIVPHPTTSQIIEKGDYLKPNFDRSTLTIPHLIGILEYHQIPYPSPHTKAKLVDVFNKEIKVNSTKLHQAQPARQATLASDDGIIDGVTGIPIAPPPAQPVRRLSYHINAVMTSYGRRVIDPQSSIFASTKS